MKAQWFDLPTAPLVVTVGADHVTILLATLNGARFLQEQLNSISAQTHQNWSLIASDDGSVDGTVELLRAFAARNQKNRVVVLRGPGAGAAQNFLSLLRAAGSSPFVAFADQDDIWFPEKLARAVDALKGRDGPALYGARTSIFHASKGPARNSLLHLRPPGFGNALIQNIAGGNTMVLNRNALDVLQVASARASGIIAHDWWCYQMVTGIGGTVTYDPVPCLGYRQHDGNLIGANVSIRSGLRRVLGIISGDWKCRIQAQLDALTANEEFLTPDARHLLKAFRTLSAKPFFARPAVLISSGAYHQRRRGNVALWLAAMAGRI